MKYLLPVDQRHPSFDGAFQCSGQRYSKHGNHSYLRSSMMNVQKLYKKGGCCRNNCMSVRMRSSEMWDVVQRWRRAWARLSSHTRRQVLMEHVRRHLTIARPTTTSESPPTHLSKHRFAYMFLGLRWCKVSWHNLTSVGVGALLDTVHRILRDDVEYQRRRTQRERWAMTALHGAAQMLINFCQERMPLRRIDKDAIIMPMHRKVDFFYMLRRWYLASLSSGTPLLPVPPKKETLRDVLQAPAFAKVYFHRSVDMGRCPVCSWYTWKVATCAPHERQKYNNEAADHQLRQLTEKHTYAKDRLEAALGFPHTKTLYCAMDASSGIEYCLPHQSPADLEVPSKALRSMVTPPMKVMNALIHGDRRAHIILSPPSVRSVGQSELRIARDATNSLGAHTEQQLSPTRTAQQLSRITASSRQ